ncbi:hypothetical protein DIU36_01730 [Mucilaginibacter rubeus]|nr:hypothetical protein DIU36_01730 [Mucilaginibacter rubeus]
MINNFSITQFFKGPLQTTTGLTFWAERYLTASQMPAATNPMMIKNLILLIINSITDAPPALPGIRLL